MPLGWPACNEGVSARRVVSSWSVAAFSHQPDTLVSLDKPSLKIKVRPCVAMTPARQGSEQEVREGIAPSGAPIQHSQVVSEVSEGTAPLLPLPPHPPCGLGFRLSCSTPPTYPAFVQHTIYTMDHISSSSVNTQHVGPQALTWEAYHIVLFLASCAHAASPSNNTGLH